MIKLEKAIYESYVRGNTTDNQQQWFTISTTSNYAKKSIVVMDLLSIYPAKLFESNNWEDLLEEATKYYEGIGK